MQHTVYTIAAIALIAAGPVTAQDLEPAPLEEGI